MPDFYLNRGEWWTWEVPFHWTQHTRQLCIDNSWILPFSFCTNLLSFAGLYLALLFHPSRILLSHTRSHIDGGSGNCTILPYFQIVWFKLYLINSDLHEPSHCSNFLYPYISLRFFFVFLRQSFLQKNYTSDFRNYEFCHALVIS